MLADKNFKYRIIENIPHSLALFLDGKIERFHLFF